MSLEPRRERFDSTTIAVVIVSLGLWTLLNWPYQYVATAHEQAIPQSAMVDLNFQTFQFPNYEYKRGGFPFVYVFFEQDAIPQSSRDWNWQLLLLNALIALISTVCLAYLLNQLRHYAFTFVWQTRFGTYSGQTLLKVGLVCGLASLAALSASVISFKDRADRRLARQLSTAGAVHRYSLVPQPLLNVVPSPVLARFARIRGVLLWGKSPEPLLRAAQIPTLTSFGTIGLAPTAECVTMISKNTRFNHLNLMNVKLDDSLCHAIEQITSLRKLELFGCQGFADETFNFSKMNLLRELELTNSDVRLASIPATGWPDSLTSLNLSRPRRGPDSLVLRDLPYLENLRIQRMDSSLNSDLVSLELANLASLKYLGIETLQKVSLKITTAPLLTAIGGGDLSVDRRANSGNDVFPISLWVESLELDGLQSLRDLNCDGSDLAELSLKNMPSLNRLAISRVGYNNGMAMREFDAQFKSRAQALIDDLSKCDGPASIDLSSLPLGGVDLSSLANNAKIRSLSMARCGVTGGQLQMISRLTRLSNLDLRGCPITDTDALELLGKKLPLKELIVHSDRFERIEVIDQPRLRCFVVTPSLRARTVQISGSPQLESEIMLGNQVERLDIQDGYSLSGLSVDGAIPVGARVQGLRSLKFFSIGGPLADDEFCASLWQCTDLDHLTIAYGGLSRKSLEKIGRFEKLTILALPGSDIDDNLVLGHWSGLIHLSDVNFSDTKVSTRTLQFLLSIGNLQKLVINHCNFSQRDLEDLVTVNQLVELEVAGIGLDVATLAGCLRRGMMDRLDLSHSELSNQHVQILAGRAGNSLRFLGLQGCELSEIQLRQIIDAHPHLAVDIAGNQASPDFIAELALKKRLLDRQDRAGFLRHIADDHHSHFAEVTIEFEPTRGRIHHDQFNTELTDE